MKCDLAWQCVKLAWHVPRQAHTYLDHNLLCSGLSSVRCDILARYVKFVRGLKVSPSVEVSVMFGVVAGDVTTTTGRNLNTIRLETGLDPLASSLVNIKEELGNNKLAVPDEDVWRMRYLAKLLEARGEAHHEAEDTHQITFPR